MPDVDGRQVAERARRRDEEPVLGAALEERALLVTQQVGLADVVGADQHHGDVGAGEGVGAPPGHRRQQVVVALGRLVVAQHRHASLHTHTRTRTRVTGRRSRGAAPSRLAAHTHTHTHTRHGPAVARRSTVTPRCTHTHAHASRAGSREARHRHASLHTHAHASRADGHEVRHCHASLHTHARTRVTGRRSGGVAPSCLAAHTRVTDPLVTRTRKAANQQSRERRHTPLTRGVTIHRTIDASR